MALPSLNLADCRLYSTSIDALYGKTLWTVELWESEDAHVAAMVTPQLQASIERCKTMIERFENIATFVL